MRYHTLLFTLGLMVGCGGVLPPQQGAVDVTQDEAAQDEAAQEAQGASKKARTVEKSVTKSTPLRLEKEAVKALSEEDLTMSPSTTATVYVAKDRS